MSDRHPRGLIVQDFSTLDFCVRLSRACTEVTRRIDIKLSSVHGLSFSDFMVLYHLERAHGSRLRRIDLANCMGLTASAVTRSLLPLEKIGLVTRQSNPRDARVGYACLTPGGTRLFASAIKTAEATCKEVLPAISMEKISSIERVLRQIAGMNDTA